MTPREILAATPFFAEPLSPAALDRLAAASEVRTFAGGRALIREDEIGASMFIIEWGEVTVKSGSGAEARHVATLGPGGIIGEMSLMTGARRSATVTATQTVKALEIPKAAVAALLAAEPGLVQRFAAMLERRQRELDHLYGGWSLGFGRDNFVAMIRSFFGGTL